MWFQIQAHLSPQFLVLVPVIKVLAPVDVTVGTLRNSKSMWMVNRPLIHPLDFLYFVHAALKYVLYKSQPALQIQTSAENTCSKGKRHQFNARNKRDGWRRSKDPLYVQSQIQSSAIVVFSSSAWIYHAGHGYTMQEIWKLTHASFPNTFCPCNGSVFFVRKHSNNKKMPQNCAVELLTKARDTL